MEKRFTGLHDKCGSPIFEGDLLQPPRGHFHTIYDEPVEVQWHEESDGFILVRVGTDSVTHGLWKAKDFELINKMEDTMRGKKAEANGVTTTEEKQGNLLDVERSEAAREADRWADIQADIETKKAALITQTEKVMNAMKAGKQRTMTITDQMGYKHTFTIVNAGEKLRHSKREEN